MSNIILIQEKSRHAANQEFRECCCLKRAFEHIHEKVDIWGLGWENFHVLPDFNSYDLIINMENYGDNWIPDLSEYSGPKKMLWAIDSHFRGLKPYLKIFNKGKYDVLLQSTKDYVNRDPNKKSIWFPNAVDDTLFSPKAWAERKNFIGYCGSRTKIRTPYLKRLRTWFGSDYQENIWVLGKEMVSAIQSYKIHFNLNIANDINYRSFETIGLGTVLCTNSNPQYNDLGFENNKNCILYDRKSDLFNKFHGNFTNLHMILSQYYNNQDQLETISRNAIRLSHKHTYKQRAKTLISLLNGSEMLGWEGNLLQNPET
jgi:hypothetical protein